MSMLKSVNMDIIERLLEAGADSNTLCLHNVVYLFPWSSRAVWRTPVMSWLDRSTEEEVLQP